MQRSFCWMLIGTLTLVNVGLAQGDPAPLLFPDMSLFDVVDSPADRIADLDSVLTKGPLQPPVIQPVVPDVALRQPGQPDDAACLDYAVCEPSCRCCPCYCRPAVPFMLGDGGLLQPRMLISGSRSFYMQNHVAKVAENNSAIPTDRVALQFNALQKVNVGAVSGDGFRYKDIQEYRILVEKTLFSPCLSAELIVPIYQTSEYHVESFGSYVLGPQLDAEFGDLAFGVKWLMRKTNRSACSLGLRVEAPTSQDIDVTFAEDSITDDVWHFTPYLALQATPSDRCFMSLFGSYRLNSTSMTSDNGTATYPIREATYLMVDGSWGYWLVDRPRHRGLTGLAPVVELHYATTPTAEPSHNLVGIPVTGWILGHTDYLTMTTGLAGSWNRGVTFGAGFAFPLRDGPYHPVYGDTDRNFDWAFVANINYLYGK